MAATTQTTTATAAPTLTVGDDMDKRRIFANTEDAAAYLNQMATTLADFAKIPFAGVGFISNEGQEDDGDFDSKVYTPDMNVMVAVLNKKAGPQRGVKCIVVTPIPSMDSVLADPVGKEWLTKIMQKELNHVAVRDLREASDVATVVDKMPTTLAAYISSARDQGGGALETFNEMYKQINTTLGAQIAVWAKAKLVKSDLKKCFESTGYAQEFYPSLENRGEGKDSLFVVGLNLGIAAAKKKGFDPTIFERWLATRNAKVFTPGEDDDNEDFDIDSLANDMVGTDEPAKAAEEPATTTEQAATTTGDAAAAS